MNEGKATATIQVPGPSRLNTRASDDLAAERAGRICPVGALLAALLTLLVAACSGGGGGGEGSPQTRPPSFFETEEYAANAGLAEIRASSAYAQGGTGAGVTVAVIDTGIDLEHPEFAGAVSAASIDIRTGRTDRVQDADGHGTAVSGVIGARKNDQLGHGVAFDSRILAIRADEDDSCASSCIFREQDVAHATDYAMANGADVINYSLGGGDTIGSGLADAMTRAVAQGALLALAAGNDGAADPKFPARFAAQPEANGQALAVGALGADGAIASFSNRAGSAQDAFLVAPGVNVHAPELGGGATRVSGTSFATAHVSGAAALVMDAAPFLSAAEVVDILLQSATDLGDAGPDPVYGHGLVNVGAALAPIGELAVPMGEQVDGERAPLHTSSLGLGPAFGPGPALGQAIFVDSYGRVYGFDLAGRVGRHRRTPDLLRFLGPVQAAHAAGAELGGGMALQLGLAEERSPYLDPDAMTGREPDRAFFLTAGLGETTALSMMRGWGLGGQFGLAAEPGLASGLITADALSSPYLALADGGEAMAVEQELGAGLRLRFGLSRAAENPAAELDPGVRHAAIAELARRFEGGASVSLQAGWLDEGESLLDSRGEGAFALDQGAATSFFGLAARLPLGDNFDLFGQASYGLTRPENDDIALLDEVSNLHSTALALGVGRSGLLSAGDRLTFTLAQPLRVTAGTAVIDRPVGRTFDGEIVRQRDRVGLAPHGREIDLELAYGLPLGPGRRVGLNWLTQLEPGHDPERRPAHALAVRFDTRF